METPSRKTDPTAPRIFIDSSVLLSGLASRKGASYALLVLAELGFVNPIVSEYVLDEVERNLLAKLSAYVPNYRRVRETVAWEIASEPSIEMMRQWASIVPDKDIPVLVAAIESRAQRLVTLDIQHFLKSPEVAAKSGLNICTPADLLRDIRAAIRRSFE